MIGQAARRTSGCTVINCILLCSTAVHWHSQQQILPPPNWVQSPVQSLSTIARFPFLLERFIWLLRCPVVSFYIRLIRKGPNFSSEGTGKVPWRRRHIYNTVCIYIFLSKSSWKCLKGKQAQSFLHVLPKTPAGYLTTKQQKDHIESKRNRVRGSREESSFFFLSLHPFSALHQAGLESHPRQTALYSDRLSEQ